MADRDVGPGEEPALLVGVAVDGEVEQVRADAAVVEQRVALARRAVAGDPLALAAPLDEELEQAPLRLLDLGREGAVALERVEAQRALALGEASTRRSLADRMPPVDRRCA